MSSIEAFRYLNELSGPPARLDNLKTLIAKDRAIRDTLAKNIADERLALALRETGLALALEELKQFDQALADSTLALELMEAHLGKTKA